MFSQVKLLRHLYAQTLGGRLHDVTLKAHGVTAHAHRAVLCAHSAYFETLLSGRWSDASVHDLSHLLWSADTLRTLVDFMYTGKVHPPLTGLPAQPLTHPPTHSPTDSLTH